MVMTKVALRKKECTLMSWWKCLVWFKSHSLSTRSINKKFYQADLVIVIGKF
jgi:hypothetical protein